MLWIIVAVDDDFTKGIVDMHILTSFANQMLEELSEKLKSVSETRYGKLDLQIPSQG